MENNFDLEDLADTENFKINPHIWLRTLLAIAGDKDKKREAVHMIAQKTGVSHGEVEVIIVKTISVLINQTRAN